VTKRLPATENYLKARRILVNEVFPELRKKGIFCRAAFYETQTSALYALSDFITEKGKRAGLVFWTLQSNETFRTTGKVDLAFNHSDENPLPEQVIEVGKLVREVCRKHGLKTRWNGTAGKKIQVSLLKRRRD